MLDMRDIHQQFFHAGITPPDPLIPDGQMHRFSIDLKDRKRSGWYRGWRNCTRRGDDFFVFVFGDNHFPDEIHKAVSNVKLEKTDKTVMQEQIRKAQRAAHKEKVELQRQAAEKAEKRWSALNDEFGKNEYLEKKGFDQLFGARIYQHDLVIPMRDIDGNLRNLETVSGSMKKGLYGGERTGLFHAIGEIKELVYLCEGFSTAATVHLAMRDCAIAAFNAGNLPAVAQALRRKYPNLKIIVCADSDRFPSEKTGEIHNVGFEKAKEAADAVGGKIVSPSFNSDEGRPTDFDDVRRIDGLDAVREQISGVKPLERVERMSVDAIVNMPYPDQNPVNGNKKGTIENVSEMLRRINITLRYNVISKDEEILIPGKIYSLDNKDNAALAEIKSWCNRVGIPVDGLPGMLTSIADQSQYNPVLTWIESRPWDGKSRLEDLYATVRAVGEDDLEVRFMKEKLIRTWMISAVAAASEPNGISAHGILTFQGAQYLGKTAWFKSLVPQELAVTADGASLDPHDDDSVMQCISKWLVELGELDSTLNRDIARIKAFTTKQTDEIRRKYAVKHSRYARRTVFFGSVNEAEFLKDKTGNRRFWTIECESLNHQHGIDTQQMWAEIQALYLVGTPWILSGDEVASLNKHNENFEVVSPIEDRIRAMYDWSRPTYRGVTPTEVCTELGIDNPTDRDRQAAGHALKKITGKDRSRIGRGEERGYFLPTKKPSKNVNET